MVETLAPTTDTSPVAISFAEQVTLLAMEISNADDHVAFLRCYHQVQELRAQGGPINRYLEQVAARLTKKMFDAMVR